MSKKKNNQKQTNRKEPSKNKEPWTRKFVEEENPKNKQYSRSARKAKNDEVAPLYKVVFFLFLALLIIPFATIYWNNRTKAAPAPQTPEQVMVNKKGTSSSDESEIDSRTESKEVAVSSSEERESSDESVEKESKKEPAEVETPPESTEPEVIPPVEPNVPETPPETEPTEPEGEYTNTYTVQAGDNLYRIALNHGMDLETLKSINGLSNDVAVIGEVLKVK
ncbi:LysM peptidoglycan-binding domain-containing protein [Jeotgalibaca sp. MA1X17-3]|uniref:LysM peptidoglycan-binding domain-containing protein n=1 Tax=Jeotgalibaca sp. MA1X17-3 TaxID=2908211 RepID=UPI001F1650C3|nr:LysM peptidoglycan-binding domain-containing protein [Jeotgalibaca sp. MA1X17-3]UJF14830.1 LysM peptidoglycan-binding domain-containing protein [Jeotgalibaca sp. MA1X17-3]